mmetsp:Transcript_19051/g.38373  ORF Transcript_19051/g.38373 Transcript_19051/m.38373 type:complete len:96 (-) Transcript_19051:1653-1940(-)
MVSVMQCVLNAQDELGYRLLYFSLELFIGCSSTVVNKNLDDGCTIALGMRKADQGSYGKAMELGGLIFTESGQAQQTTSGGLAVRHNINVFLYCG